MSKTNETAKATLEKEIARLERACAEWAAKVAESPGEIPYHVEWAANVVEQAHHLRYLRGLHAALEQFGWTASTGNEWTEERVEELTSWTIRQSTSQFSNAVSAAQHEALKSMVGRFGCSTVAYVRHLLKLEEAE